MQFLLTIRLQKLIKGWMFFFCNLKSWMSASTYSIFFLWFSPVKFIWPHVSTFTKGPYHRTCNRKWRNCSQINKCVLEGPPNGCSKKWSQGEGGPDGTTIITHKTHSDIPEFLLSSGITISHTCHTFFKGNILLV